MKQLAAQRVVFVQEGGSCVRLALAGDAALSALTLHGRRQLCAERGDMRSVALEELHAVTVGASEQTAAVRTGAQLEAVQKSLRVQEARQGLAKAGMYRHGAQRRGFLPRVPDLHAHEVACGQQGRAAGTGAAQELHVAHSSKCLGEEPATALHGRVSEGFGRGAASGRAAKVAKANGAL